MAKKLMMNNYSENNDIIVLCKDFSPNGQPFCLIDNEIIDWDKYELYINVNITNITKAWQHILAISVDNITEWAGNKLHLYSAPNTIRIDMSSNRYASNHNINDNYLSCTEIIINKDGIRINGILVLKWTLNINTGNTWKHIISKPNIIGSAIPNDLPVATYNLVKLQPYKERS